MSPGGPSGEAPDWSAWGNHIFEEMRRLHDQAQKQNDLVIKMQTQIVALQEQMKVLTEEVHNLRTGAAAWGGGTGVVGGFIGSILKSLLGIGGEG